MTATLPLFCEEISGSEDILHAGKIYRPYRKGMEDGWDNVKSGERRPHGWGRYLFVGGYVVFDAETRRCVDSVRDLPTALKRPREDRS